MSTSAHPGQPPDIDLNEWLDGVGFHPADTELKQRGHEAARLLVALLATHLHQLLPAGRLKSLAFAKLEEVLQRANQSLAVGKGPHPLVAIEQLQGVVDETKRILAQLEAVVPYDPRISEYEAEQRGEPIPSTDATAAPVDVQPREPFKYVRHVDGGPSRTIEAALTGVGVVEPEFLIKVREYDEGENRQDSAMVFIDRPEILEELAADLLAAAVQLRTLRAR